MSSYHYSVSPLPLPCSFACHCFFCSRVWFKALHLDCSSPSIPVPFPIADRCCCTSVCFVVQVCLSYVFCQCIGVPFSLAECSLSALFVVFCFQLCLWPRSDTSETFHQFLQDILHLTTAPVHSQIKYFLKGPSHDIPSVQITQQRDSTLPRFPSKSKPRPRTLHQERAIVTKGAPCNK